MSDKQSTLVRFLEYAADSPNWNGSALVGGNVGGDPEDKGYIVNMKKRGWIVTEPDYDNPRNVWMHFTEEGRKVAAENGIEIQANIF